MNTTINNPLVATTPVRKRRFLTKKKILLTFLTLVLLGVLAVGGIGLYYSNVLLQVDHSSPTYGIQVTGVAAQAVTLQRTWYTQQQGVFGIDWPEGQAIVGPIISLNATSVTRQFVQSTAPLLRGTMVKWDTSVYEGTLKNSLGLTINDVSVPDPLGPMPAWF